MLGSHPLAPRWAPPPPNSKQPGRRLRRQEGIFTDHTCKSRQVGPTPAETRPAWQVRGPRHHFPPSQGPQSSSCQPRAASTQDPGIGGTRRRTLSTGPCPVHAASGPDTEVPGFHRTWDRKVASLCFCCWAVTRQGWCFWCDLRSPLPTPAHHQHRPGGSPSTRTRWCPAGPQEGPASQSQLRTQV